MFFVSFWPFLECSYVVLTLFGCGFDLFRRLACGLACGWVVSRTCISTRSCARWFWFVLFPCVPSLSACLLSSVVMDDRPEVYLQAVCCLHIKIFLFTYPTTAVHHCTKCPSWFLFLRVERCNLCAHRLLWDGEKNTVFCCFAFFFSCFFMASSRDVLCLGPLGPCSLVFLRQARDSREARADCYW